jgi:hypothetical protein
MKKLLYISIFISSLLLAKPIYSFKSVGISYLDWTNPTENKTSQRDFGYLKLEGGIGYEWMDLYGYVSMENPTKPYHDEAPFNQRYVGFTDFDITIKDGFKFHIQDFFSNGNNFYVNDFVFGFAYKYFNKNGFWIKPFIAFHYTNDTYFNGMNGYMGGWVFDYHFDMFEQKFSLFNWNEIEFARTKRFYEANDGTPIGDGESHGLNGAIDLWWHINESFTTGVEYRYANHKLGSIEYQSAIVYNLKYNF